MPEFVHLHVHSQYSLLDGMGKIPDLIGRAKELNMPAIALTDHGVMHGSIEFYKAAKKAGIKPIVGCEIYISPRKMTDKEGKVDQKAFHLTLLAKNAVGYKNLIALTSAGHTLGYYYKPRVDKAFLRQHAEGLICLTGCLAAEIPRAIIAGDEAKVDALVKEYFAIFGKDNVYFEIQDHPNIEECQKIVEVVPQLAKKYGRPVVATNDVHYVRAEDAEAQDVLVCISTGKQLADTNRMSYIGTDYSLRTAEDIAAAFKQVPESLETTLHIAEQCNLELELGNTILPHFPVPEGETQDSWFETQCWQGLMARYGEQVPEGHKERLKYELGVIRQMGYAAYFLIVQDFVLWAKSRNIAVGPGRGSAAGSIAAYCLQITDLDPMEHRLLFERFLNPERVSMPDIDMDFEDTRRGEVIGYVTQKYGPDHVSQICTFGTMAAKNAVRDVGRVLGIPYGDVDTIAKLIPEKMNLKQARSATPELEMLIKTDPRISQLYGFAEKLEGNARHTGMHAAGIVISREPLTEYLPVMAATKGEAELVTQYAMGEIEDIGLLKMDFLGLANLSIIQNAVRLIEETHGKKIDIANVPLDDKETYKLLSRAETMGVFQIECLAGDTIVSNTTIKKLHEKQHKKTLESVYVDEGAVHHNRILGVVKSGKKPVYTVIAENGWCIKASAKHKFLTDQGWQELQAIRPGDKVLMKNKAKHVVFNECRSCGQQISGQKEGQSRYCYTCSARHYSNPSKPISRAKITAARLAYYADGHEPWNKGKDVHSDERVRATGQKISRALTGLTLEMKFGPEEAARKRHEQSMRMSGRGNHMFGVKPPHRKGGYRADLGHYVRSNWEADFARILNLHHIPYLYEPHTFPVELPDGQVANYTPDFYVPSEETYYEIKGFMRDIDQAKMDAFETQYPHKKLVLINTTTFAEFAMTYRSLVAWECPKIPEQQFAFQTVQAIRPAGIEETYDISMEAPGNNFVANGFVVHNSAGMRRYLAELKPTKFTDIVAMVALYRPGPMERIPTYINRKHGRETVTYLHPDLKDILEDTYGVLVYQEQVQEMAQKFAGFSLGEGYLLVKAVAKKKKELLDEQRIKFIEGAKKIGNSEQMAGQLFDFIEPFARYGFNRAHSACYAYIAYQTAYLKAHYPAEFMAAWLIAEQQNIEKMTVALEECERMKLPMLPPDINRSRVDFAVVRDKAAEGREEILFGLSAIKNVGISPATAIVAEREQHGPFDSLTDLLRRLGTKHLNKKVLEALAQVGALDRFGERNVLVLGVEEMTIYMHNAEKQLSANMDSLFGEAIAVEEPELYLPPQPPADITVQLGWEKGLLGIYLSEHPATSVAKRLGSTIQTIGQFSLRDRDKMVRLAGVVGSVKKIITKSNQAMAFARLEDASGNIEAVVFPSVLETTHDFWQTERLLIVTGRLNDKDGSLKLLVESVIPYTDELDPTNLPEVSQTSVRRPRPSGQPDAVMNQAAVSASSPVDVSLPPSISAVRLQMNGNLSRPLLEELRGILSSHSGSVPIVLAILKNNQEKQYRLPAGVSPSPLLKRQLSRLLGEEAIVLQ